MLAAVLSFAAPGARAEEVSESGGGGLQRWLHQPQPDQIFRYYGFWEAVDKYFRAQILNQEPDSSDVTQVTETVDRDAERDAVRAEVSALQKRLAGIPAELKERAEWIAEMKQKRARIEEELNATRARLQAAGAGFDSQDISRNAEAWDARTRFDLKVENLKRTLAQTQDEIERTELGRFKLMQTGALEEQIAAKKAELAAIVDPENTRDLYLVSHRPLLLVVCGVLTALALLAIAGARLPGSVGGPLGVGLTAALGATLYTLSEIVRIETIGVPALGIFGSPMLLGVGLPVLMGTRALGVRRGVRDPGRRSLQLATAAAALIVSAQLVGSGAAALGAGAGSSAAVAILWSVVGSAIPVALLGAWAFAVSRVLDSQLAWPQRSLAIAGVSYASVAIEGMTPWLGMLPTLKIVGMGFVLACVVFAMERALAGLASGGGTQRSHEADAVPQPKWA
jgi:hypothetical protein